VKSSPRPERGSSPVLLPLKADKSPSDALTLRKTYLQKVFGRTKTPALGGDVTSVKRMAPKA